MLKHVLWVAQEVPVNSPLCFEPALFVVVQSCCGRVVF